MACNKNSFIKLRNLRKETEVVDILHRKAYTPMECSSHHCLGSKFFPPFERPDTTPRPKDQVLSHAQKFMEEYYSSLGKADTPKFLERMKDVTNSVEKTGTYDLTYEELVFGTKTAWRNTPRCLGRPHWQTLKVFDARHVKTTQEMYEHLLELMDYSNNNGNVRGAITIFPKRTDGLNDFRIWNAQVIRYAGYEQPDGSIIGDPISKEITEVCLKLGWKGKGGPFDVLPLLLSANGQDPELYELPEDLILEVLLEHPKYTWFKELGLRWYVVAGISNMLFDCGGLEFTAAPFTGWLMDTEVGTRNLCDTQRYNIVPMIAEKMGLDVKKNSSQWREKAVLEVNIAILHSYNKTNMTMTDHFTAAEAFHQHWEKEYQVRNGCPADWVWIIPPIGGSLMSVFHQEMLYYRLKPSMEYQQNIIKIHKWKKPENIAIFTRERRWDVTFSVLAKAVFFTSIMYRMILQQRIPCTILYASETGTAQLFAEKLARNFRLAFNTKVIGMDSYDINNILSEKLLLVVASTFGSGQPPANGKVFGTILRNYRPPEEHKESKCGQDFRNVRFSVFGLGNSSYAEFCAFAKFVDRRLFELGAKSLHALGEGDELGGLHESFEAWSKEVLKISCKEFGFEAVKGLDNDQSLAWAPDKFRTTVAFVSAHKDVCEHLSSIHKKKIFQCSIVSRRHLQTPSSTRQTMHASLSLNCHPGVKYLPGDHVGIYPVNDSHEVNNILNYVHMIPGFDEDVEVQVKDGDKWQLYTRLPSCSPREALTHFLDITTPPSKIFLKRLAEFISDNAERDALVKLATNTDEYEDWKRTSLPTLLHVLSQFPSVRGLPSSFLLSQLPLLQQRFYSISSSQQAHPDEIHVTYAVVQYVTPGKPKDVRGGICTTWLRDCKETTMIPCFIKSAPGFHLPADPGVPVIMVATGTGIAPIRGFWQQRRVDLGKIDMTQIMNGCKNNRKERYVFALYFGCRNNDVDNIYREELKDAFRDSVLSHLNFAFSRQPGMKKTYVQHLLLRDSEFIYSVLTARKGHIYICGDSNMAADVRNTLEKIYAQCKDADNKESSQFVQQLQFSGRLHEDIFGVKMLSP